MSTSRARGAVAANIRAFAALVRGQDATAAALRLSYADSKSCEAILKDGEHLAAAVDALIGTPNAAKGARAQVTSTKDDAVGALARWLHRWTLVANRVVDPAGQAALGLSGTRHHPAHRKQHPADGAPGATSAKPQR